MFYLYSMAFFFVVGFIIAKCELKWPWLWLVLAPIVGCALLFIVGDWLYPPQKPVTEVTFRILVPVFFIPPNFLAVVVGYLVVNQWLSGKEKG